VIYAHTANGTIDLVVPPSVVYHAGRWWDLRYGFPADQGWHEVNEPARPADTTAATWDRGPVELINGVPTLTWVERAWTQAELAARTAAANEQTLRDGIAAEITTLKTSIDTLKTGVLGTTNATINGSPASYIKDTARAVRTTERSLIRVLKLISGAVADTDIGAT